MLVSFVRIIIMLLWIYFFYYFSGNQQSTIHYLLHKNCWPDFFSSSPLTFLSPSLPAFLFPLYLFFILPSSVSHSFLPSPPLPFPITPERHTVGYPLKKAGHISYLRRLKSTVLLCTWNFFPTVRALIGYFEVTWRLTTKNVSRQNLWTGNIATSMMLRIIAQCTVIRGCWPLSRFIFIYLSRKSFSSWAI